MRIAIDVRSTLKKEKAGIGYYTLNLINALAKIDKENSYYLYSKIKFFSLDKKPPILPSQNFKHKIDRFDLGPPRLLKNIDIFHTSSFDIKPPKGAKFIITVHDIIPKVFPQGHTKDAIEKLDASLKHVLLSADFIVADTQSTFNDLTKYYPHECAHKLRVVYPGVGEEFVVLPKNAKNLYNRIFLKYNIYSNYIIYIGTLEPRKNITGLIKAYHSLKSRYSIKQQLVIAGMKGWMYEDIFKLVDELGLNKEIIFTGYIPREELKIFYNFADLSVYPSFYEGAGLPVLEAFKCGCPVVTSNISSMPEFAGDAAMLIDPNNVDFIAEGIHKILSNPELRSSLIEKGLKRAKEFTWERTAQQMLSVFNSLSS